jgi:diguanylate cyclase (GGDEF)-like protein
MGRMTGVLIAGCLLAGPAAAQLYTFDHYGISDGLPQTQVLSSHQDPTGYLWFGSYGGVSRYNGRDFQTYTTADGLGANVVQDILTDPFGRLWVGTGAGACRLEPLSRQFTCLDHPTLSEAYVYTLYSEADRLWIGTSLGLFEYTYEGEAIQHHGLGDISASESVRSIQRGPEGQIFAGTLDGLVVRDSRTGHWRNQDLPLATPAAVHALSLVDGALWIGSSSGPFQLRDGRIRRPEGIPEGFLNADVSAMAIMDEETLWLASERGAIRWQAGRSDWIRRTNGLADDNIHSVYVDAEDMVWLGHDDGLSKWVPSPFVGYTAETGMHGGFVRSLAKDERNRLWLGTRDGVQVIEKREGRWDFEGGFTITEKDGLLEQRIFSIAFPGSGEALLGTANGLMLWREGEGVVRRMDETDGLPNARVLAMFRDSQGRNWIGTVEGVAFYRDGEILPGPDALADLRYPIRIKEDSQGRIWFATVESGAWRMDTDGELARFQSEDGLTNETLWDLAADDQGGMWLASNGDGLFHLDADDALRRYSIDDGLVDNFGWQVLHDEQGRVWVYTNRGLVRYDRGEFRTFTLADGLLHLEGGATSALECHDGRIWFGSAAGLSYYDPVREYDNRRPPPVMIESVTLNGEPVSEHSVLPNRSGTLDFHYSALTFHDESAVRFRYRLLGVSDRWSEIMDYRPITLAGLGGGDYVFEVEARNPHGVWSDEPQRFEFEVKPPIWGTFLFWLLILPMIVGLLWLLVYWRLRLARQRRRELEALVQSRTQELEAANRQLEAATITDPLTGLKNRRYLINQIGADVAQAMRAYQGDRVHDNQDIVFIMIDLDHFKEINDRYGHAIGDKLLTQFAKIVHSQLRESDYVVRWGGEEFLVVARQTEASHCQVMIERIMQEARGQKFEVDHSGEVISCTCSAGISQLPFNATQPQALNWEQVVDLADVAVYMAKRLGRDGWVSLHGVGDQPIEDSMTFMRRVKTDMAGLVAEGQIRIESSFDEPLKGASDIDIR